MGSDAVVECLIREGVDVIFAYPGGASQELHQSLARTDKIRVILPRHEQGGSFAAEGYARVTGKVGVCMATSGPGATNLVSAIADAYMDSIPLVAITGQVKKEFIGKMAFQETDFFGMTLPIVKHSYLVMDVHELPGSSRRPSTSRAAAGRGPSSSTSRRTSSRRSSSRCFPAATEFRNPILSEEHRADDDSWKVLALVSGAKKPVIYAGGGIISAEAHKELRAFAELTNIPVATTLMGVGVFPGDPALSMQWFGMHGAAYGNWAVDESDLLLVPRGPLRRPDHRRHPQVRDPREDRPHRHRRLRAQQEQAGQPGGRLRRQVRPRAPERAHRRREVLAARHQGLARADRGGSGPSLQLRPSKHIQPQEAVKVLYELTKGDAIITTGVGQHQMWAAQFYRFDEPRRYISSLGLGAMGFGYPAALGAKVARPDKQVIDIDGDGSFAMNIQELATAHIEKIGAKAMILNNQHLGMVVQWEDRFYGSVRGNTILGDESNVGSPDNPDALYPDFVKIAEGFGVKGRRVIRKSELRAAIQEMLDHDGPFVLDVVVPYTEHVLPMIPAGKSVKEMLLK
jgi:acetolactate synthase-1/2/3 large subunit